MAKIHKSVSKDQQKIDGRTGTQLHNIDTCVQVDGETSYSC